MTPDPDLVPAVPDRGRRLRRTLVVCSAGLLAAAAVVVPLAVHARTEDRPAATPVPTAAAPEGGAAVRFGRFPLDRGWAEAHGAQFVDGPGPGAGGISMPEGHCHDEVLFASGHQDKLSSHVGTDEVSRTREILGYEDADAARSAFRALRDAVSGCTSFDDPFTGEVAYTAEVHESIDEANARAGTRTFTFAYTSPGTEPFSVLYQFALVDDVLYGSNAYGAWSAGTARDAIADLDEENVELFALLPRIER